MTGPGGVGTAEYLAVTQRLTDEQKTLLRRAGQAERRVHQLYPPPVAKVLADALQAYIDFGNRFVVSSDTIQLIDFLLNKPLP